MRTEHRERAPRTVERAHADDIRRESPEVRTALLLRELAAHVAELSARIERLEREAVTHNASAGP